MHLGHNEPCKDINFLVGHITGKTKISLRSLIGQSAQSLFPDLFQNESAKAKQSVQEKPPSKVIVPPSTWFTTWWGDEQAKPSKVIAPPPPPDTSWLANAASGEQQERAEDVPLALLALGEQAQQELMAKKLAKMGYVVTTANSAMQALECLGSNKCRQVFCSTDAAFAEVRRFVNQLAADQRRRIYFVLVGADLHTLYDMEALALSANLVVNDRDLPSLELILDSGLRQYEQLFRPLIDLIDSTSSFK